MGDDLAWDTGERVNGKSARPDRGLGWIGDLGLNSRSALRTTFHSLQSDLSRGNEKLNLFQTQIIVVIIIIIVFLIYYQSCLLSHFQNCLKCRGNDMKQD